MHFEVKFEPDSKYFKTEIATVEQNREPNIANMCWSSKRKQLQNPTGDII